MNWRVYGEPVAWLWWLLAPVMSTFAGGAVLWWRSRRESRTRPGQAMREHQALLLALAQPHPGDPLPVTMLVLDGASQD